MSLSDTAIRNAKPGDKARKLADEKGLYVEIRPEGGKWWRLRYRFGGKGKLLSLGVYPDVGLAAARHRPREHLPEGRPAESELMLLSDLASAVALALDIQLGVDVTPRPQRPHAISKGS